MSVENKVPEIRFNGFSGEWAEETLGAIAEIKTGPFGSTLHAKAYVEDGHAIITTEHFKSGELPVDKKGIPQVSDDDYLRLKAYLLKVGDIVFSRVGSVDINAHVTNKQEGWLFSGRVLRVRSGKSIDSEYLHHELSTSRVKKSVISRAVGQTMPSINTEILKITPIHFPLDTTEQIATGNYFQKLDALINQHQQKHDKLSSIKKSMLEKMFPKQGETMPEIRFKGFSGEWEEKSLRSIASNISDGDWIESNHIFNNGKYRIVQTGNIGIGEFLDKPRHAKFFNQYDFDVIKANEIYAGDILISRLAEPAGRTVILPETGFKMVTAVDVTIVRPEKGFNAYFLMTKLNTDESLKAVSEGVSGTSHKRISRANLVKIMLALPSIKEQTAIGNYFKKLDNLINQHQQQITKLNNIKQACLSKMFV